MARMSKRQQLISRYLTQFHEEDLIRQPIQVEDEIRKILRVIKIQLDAMILLEFDMQLGNEVLNGFQNEVLHDFEQVFFSLRHNLGFDDNIGNNLTCLMISVVSVPCPVYGVQELRRMFHSLPYFQRPNQYSRFFRVEGIITKTGNLNFKIHSRLLNCCSKTCNYSKIVKYSDNGIKQDLCFRCRRKMIENEGETIFMVNQEICLSEIESSSNGCYQKEITLLLENIDVNSFKIGERIEVTGIFDLFANTPRIPFIVKNIICNDQKVFNELPPIFLSWRKSKYLTPWNMTNRIIDNFGCGILPRKIYRKIKLSLLLSLLSISQDSNEFKRSTIHLLFISKDSHHLKRLLDYSLQFSKFQYYNPTCCKLGKPFEPKNQTINEAGILTMSRNGVLFIDHLDKLGESKSFSLSNFMENGKYGTENKITCSVWGQVTEPLIKKNKVSSNFLGLTLPGNILSRFDLIFHLEDGDDLELERTLCGSFLYPQSPSISFEEIEKFIQFASTISVKLSQECQELLQRYFLSCRRIRENNSKTEMSVLTMEALIRIAEAHTKLCLRQVGQIQDAVVSIMLVEESLTTLYGSSTLGFSKLRDDKMNLDFYISETAYSSFEVPNKTIEQIENEKIHNFTTHLIQFCRNYSHSCS